MARGRALAHPVPARRTDLAIQLHGMNPPTLPVTGKGSRSGRVLLRRSGTVPPLPWSAFAPPFALHRGQTEEEPYVRVPGMVAGERAQHLERLIRPISVEQCPGLRSSRVGGQRTLGRYRRGNHDEEKGGSSQRAAKAFEGRRHSGMPAWGEREQGWRISEPTVPVPGFPRSRIRPIAPAIDHLVTAEPIGISMRLASLSQDTGCLSGSRLRGNTHNSKHADSGLCPRRRYTRRTGEVERIDRLTGAAQISDGPAHQVLDHECML